MVHDIEELLGQLWRLNKADGIRQAREAGLVSGVEICTFDPAGAVVSSPMLRARYACADAWQGAALGQDWPALREVAVLSNHLRGQAWHRAHMQALAWALPGGIEPARTALLGIGGARQQATYLIWRDHPEPMVCAFYGGGADFFLDLRRYIEFLLGERLCDDSVEILARPATLHQPLTGPRSVSIQIP